MLIMQSDRAEDDGDRKVGEVAGQKREATRRSWTQEGGNQEDDALGTPVLDLKVPEHRLKIF